MIRSCNTLAAGLVACLAVPLAGCAATGPIPAQYDEARHYPNISLSQQSLSRALGFQDPIVTRTRNDLLHVTVPMRSRSNDTLHVDHRVIWLDKEGRPIPPEMSWAPLRLDPRQPHRLVATATSREAEDYNIQMRWSLP